MNCCAALAVVPDSSPPDRKALLAGAVRAGHGGAWQLGLTVGGMRGARCAARIVRTLRRLPGVTDVRADLGARRVALEWEGPAARAWTLASIVERLGFTVHPLDPDAAGADRAPAPGGLFLRLAVAVIAALYIMLLTGLVGSGPDPATRGAVRLISGIVAVAAVAFSGWPFLAPAATALRHGRIGPAALPALTIPLALAAGLLAGAAMPVLLIALLLLVRLAGRQRGGKAA